MFGGEIPMRKSKFSHRQIVGYIKRVEAGETVPALLEKRLLVSGSHKAPLRLGFPIDVVERWFPRLYPAA